MKKIVKSAPRDCLAAAKDRGWNWDEFHSNAHDEYIACRDQAISEQHGECAYTGIWIGVGSNVKIHIDHFRKKSLYPLLTFHWPNLFAAVKNPDYGADFKDRSIHGPVENSDRHYDRMLSPLDANLKNYFWYRQDGMIEPNPVLDEVEDKDILTKIRHTIEIFNLNAPYLAERRRHIIETIRNLSQLTADEVIYCMETAGFSFVTEFELQHRSFQIPKDE